MRTTHLVGVGLSTVGILLSMTGRAHAAGPPPQPNAAQTQLAIRKLGVVGSVLYIAAHPDDENTALLAYLANGALLRTGYLSITRGDGGQNLVGSEQGPELGLIRTQELLAARRIDGAEQFFTRARDFGYSKSPDETLRIWGKDAVLADVVWVIRRFRPDAIITRFSPEPSDTHGHHTASAMLAVEAFRAAADPQFHPEQLVTGVTVWQAHRLLWNRSTFFSKPGEDFSHFDKWDVGGYNALLGASYGEIAADSRSMHKSQGFGVARARASNVEYFSTLAEAGGGTTKKGALLEGIDFSWGRIAGTAGLHAAIEKVVHGFNPSAPEASIPDLLECDAALDAVPDATWRARKKGEVRDLIVACAGLFLDATAADFRAAPGTDIEVTATAIGRSGAPVILKEVGFPVAGGTAVVGKSLTAPLGGVTGPVEIKRKLTIPPEFSVTTPYWLASPPTAGLFSAPDPRSIGTPEDEPPLRVDFILDVGHRAIVVSRPIAFKWIDPVAGERYRAFEVTPIVSVRPDTKVLMFPTQRRGPAPLTVHLVAGASTVVGTVRADVPPGWTVEPARTPFEIGARGQEIDVKFQVRREAAPVRGGEGGMAATLRFVAEVGPARLSRGVVHIEHSHIPIQTWLADADVRLVPVALETAGKKIGYIPGPGDEVPASLRRVGYDVSVIGDEALREGISGLVGYDAVVVGVRAFNSNERLRAAHPALMKYVESGGTLVVQYNTNSRLGPLTVPIGPFPFEIGHDRVTDEAATVTFSNVTHPVLTTPNRIAPKDFDGWIQERGLYFATKWDPKYETMLSMHDPDEKALSGSVLCAKYGKGMFVYTGLAFFRQLPAGVPGAYRLFANLLARRPTVHAR